MFSVIRKALAHSPVFAFNLVNRDRWVEVAPQICTAL